MIRLRPSQIDLSSKDLEEAHSRLKLRRAARVSGSGKVGRRVDERLLRHVRGRENGDPFQASREQGQSSNTTGNPPESRSTFAATVRSLLHGSQVEMAAQPSSPVVHSRGDAESSPQDDLPCHDGRGDGERLPFLSRSPSVGRSGYEFRSNDHWGQREEAVQRSLSHESVRRPRVSPERELREVERRFSEGLNLDGSPSDLHSSSHVNSSSSSASTTVEGYSPPRLLSGSRDGLQDLRRSRLPPSRLFISHTTLSSSPDKETLIPGARNGARDEQRNMATRFLDRVRRYRQRTTSHSFAESEPDSNGAYEQSQDTRLSPGGAVSTEPTSPPPVSPTSPEGSPVSNELSEDMAYLTRFPPNVSFIPIRDPSTLSSDSSSLPPEQITPTPRSRRYPRYRSRSPLAHSPSSSPGPLTNLIHTASRYLLPSSSPSSPASHRSMRVYNDSLPASIQPQTPSNRYTRPFNPAQTAPITGAGGRLTQIFRRSRRQGRSGSLGRAGDEQENVSAWVEVERLERRIRESFERRRRRWRSSTGSGFGRPERMDVDADGDALDRTPEREVVIGGVAGAGVGLRVE